MAKTRQVLHFVDQGKEYMVIRHFGVSANPYRIYHLYRTWGDDNRPHDHKVCVEQYGNLASCFYWFLQNNIGF